MKLRRALKLIRTVDNLSLRDLAKQIGVSAPTLSRIERGFPCDAETFGRVFLWLLSADKAA